MAAADRMVISFTGGDGLARIDIDWIGGSLGIERFGKHPWRGDSQFTPTEVNDRNIEIFVDGPVIEFFMLDLGISASLTLGSGATPFTVAAQSVEGSVQVFWDELA